MLCSSLGWEVTGILYIIKIRISYKNPFQTKKKTSDYITIVHQSVEGWLDSWEWEAFIVASTHKKKNKQQNTPPTKKKPNPIISTFILWEAYLL